MVEQFGFAIMPVWPVRASGLTSGTTRGTDGSIRKADELSTTTAPAAMAAAAYCLEREPPALKKAISMSLKLDSVSSSTTMSWSLKRMVVSTYQAASGAGAAAMRELETQTAAILAGNAPEPEIFPHPIAFNLFSHNTAIDETGYNEEELKMVKETRKILSDDSLAVTATCIRVPIPRAHSESVNIEVVGERPSVAAIQSALAAFPGVVVVDDREANVFPMPLYASGRDEVFVGRIREDISCPNAIDLFLSGDQILKGASLNGYQIAECLIERGLLGGKK